MEPKYWPNDEEKDTSTWNKDGEIIILHVYNVSCKYCETSL